MKSYSIAYLSVEMMIPEIPGYFRGGLGDLAGHVPEGMISEGIKIIPITIGYPTHWQTCQSINYAKVPGAHFLFNLDVDIYFPPIRKTVPIFAIDRSGVQTYLINDPDAGFLYPADDGLSLRQAAFYGRAVQALLKRIGIPDIMWYQEWRSACTTMPNALDDPNFANVAHLYTNHTSRPEALPTFPVCWFDGLAIDRRYFYDFIANGRINPDHGCVKLADMVTGVSEEHGEALRANYPDRAAKIQGILNGVSRDFMLSPRLKKYSNPNEWQLWIAHDLDKTDFINFVNGHVRENKVSAPIDGKRFLITIVRRFAEYKNILPIFRDIIKNICAHGVNVVICGVAHENDSACRGWMREFSSWMEDSELKGKFVYIARYNENIRRMAARGCDAWVECPWKRSEACGTGTFGAWMNGNLVIATKGGGAKQHGTEVNPKTCEGDTLFIEPYEPKTLETQILRALTWYNNFVIGGDEYWLRLRKNCYEGGKELDVSGMVKRYDELCFQPLLALKCQGGRSN